MPPRVIRSIEWRRPAATTGPCMEVGRAADDTVAVRRSTNPGLALAFTPEEWRVFILGVKDGEFDDLT